MDMDKMMKEAVEVIKKHINGVIDYAINMYGSTPHTKSKVISIVVGQFIAEHLAMLGADDMLKNGRVTSGTGRVDMNMLLDGLGNAGTRIGALAYVLAMRLEAILPEDNSGVQDVAAVETIGTNEYRLVGMAPPTPDFKLSDCYKGYIAQDQFVADIFLNNNVF